jgi:hypothetical protein
MSGLDCGAARRGAGFCWGAACRGAGVDCLGGGVTDS